MIGCGPTSEVQQKVLQIRQLSSQIADLLVALPVNERGHNKVTPEQALALQELQQRRAELVATLPRLKVVTQERVV